MVYDPFVHFCVHYIEWHNVEKSYEETHAPYKGAADLVFAENSSKDFVAEHAHICS